MKDFDPSKTESFDTIFRNGIEVTRLFDKNGNLLGEVIIDPKEQGEIRDEID